MRSRRRPKCRTTGKIIYREHPEAMSAAEYLMATDFRRTLRLFVYRCHACRHFHLTKNKNPGRQPEKMQVAD